MVKSDLLTTKLIRGQNVHALKKTKKKKEEEAYPLAMYHLDFDLIIVINNIQPVKARTSATFTEAYCYSRALFLCSSKL